MTLIDPLRLPPAEQIDRDKARAAFTGAMFGCLALIPDIAAVFLSGSATLPFSRYSFGTCDQTVCNGEA